MNFLTSGHLTVYPKSCSWVPWFSTETFDILTQSPFLLSHFHESVVMRIIMINLYLWTNGVNLMRVRRGWSYFACSKAYKEIRQANDWYLERRILIVILLEIAILTNFLNHMTSLRFSCKSPSFFFLTLITIKQGFLIAFFSVTNCTPK